MIERYRQVFVREYGCWVAATRYEYGYDKPNYPMPAIPLKVGITRTMVWVMPAAYLYHGSLSVWFKLVAWKYRKGIAVNQKI